MFILLNKHIKLLYNYPKQLEIYNNYLFVIMFPNTDRKSRVYFNNYLKRSVTYFKCTKKIVSFRYSKRNCNLNFVVLVCL